MCLLPEDAGPVDRSLSITLLPGGTWRLWRGQFGGWLTHAPTGASSELHFVLDYQCNMKWSKAFLVLCLIAALTALSDGFFIKKKLKKLLLAKALIKGPILAIGAASAGKALKAKAALPAGVALGAGATALLGQSSGSSSATPKPVPSYYPSIAPAVVAPPGGYAYPSYPSASAAPAHSGSYTYSSTAAPAHEDGYNYPVPGSQDPAPPASNYGAQSWGASAPAAHSVQYYEQPQAVGYSSVSGSPHNSNNYGPIGGSLGSNNYQQPAW